MDGHSSLERRYSFNIGQTTPVAESTHLNGSNFCWGSSMNPKHRSNSSICLNNTHGSTVYSKSIIVSPKYKNITKIDARIAADVQSKGLASRIVKYHESGTRLNRSMSAHNLYNKPGQFPVVTLKKTELPYRATKQELSMIRIPPPEKSSFYGNTISSLLSSSSVVGLQPKRTEDLSRENRPIIHPPPSENDMAPTRSVLDVLKEISRKRINSEDLEKEETSKKYCNRAAGNDFVDTSSGIQQNFIPSSIPSQRYKRQRDCITPQKNLQLFELKTSPEQAKKRVCNYNNDITSSLSSSKLYCNSKRVSAHHNLNQTMPTNLESYVTQKAKMQRYNDHINKNNSRVDERYENLENSLRKVDTMKPITPIPPTPCGQDPSNNGGIPPMRTISEPLFNAEGKITINSIQPSNKPRLTLFNKKCEDETNTVGNESNETMLTNSDDFKDFDECAGIPFVKPKKISSISGLKNPFIERTQKSKLALMLSGLRGELYQNTDADELDLAKSKPIKTNNKIITNTSDVMSAVKSTPTITTLTTVTSSSNAAKLITSTPSVTLANITPSALPTTTAPKKSSPLVGLKLSQPKPSSENVANAFSNNATKSAENLTKPSIPVLGGFSFCITSFPLLATAMSNSTPKGGSSTIKTIPTSGGQFTPLNPTTTLDNTNKLSLNSPTATKDNPLQPLAANTTNSFTPINNFSFGSKVTAPASTNSNLTQNTETKPTNTFNFTLPSGSPSNATSSTKPITFGTLTISAAASTSVGTISTSTPTFSGITSTTNLSTTSFTFNAPKQSSSSEKVTPSSSGVSSVSFSFGSNLTAPSVYTFATNTNADMKTQSVMTSPNFSFGAETKLLNSSEQNKTSIANQNDNNAFKSNPSTLFGSPSFNAVTTGGSLPAFGNASSSSNTSILGLNSTKLVPNTDKNSTVVNTPSLFVNSNTNSNTTTPFSFGSKPEIAQTTNSNNTNSASSGFSFGSAVSNSSDGGTFSFGSKTSGSTQNTSNTFGNATTSKQNQNFTFGSTTKSDNAPSVFGGAVNKPSENTSSGGFSFGSAMSPKSSAFTFGSGGNSFSGTNAVNTNNSTVGFSFGETTAAASKSNEISTNKPFSFASAQPPPQRVLPAPGNNSSSTNIFASSNADKTAPAPAFNFNAAGSTNLQQNAQTASNIFAPSPSNIASGPGDRPIRRATRRLQK